MKDYYTVLGVEKTSTLPEIRKAYHKLALKYHPDRNQGSKESEDKFREISAAYNVLSDDRQRQRYDHEQARPAPRSAPGGSYTPPPAPNQEAWATQTRKYEAVKNSWFYRQGERRRAQNEQRTPFFGSGGMVFDEMAGTSLQAAFDAGTPLKIVPGFSPILGASVRVVEPFGTIPGFSLWTRGRPSG